MIDSLNLLSRERREAVLRDWLTDRLERYLDCAQLDPGVPLAQYGIDSLIALNLYGDLEEAFDLAVEVTVVLDYPTVEALAQHLAQRFEGLDPAFPERRRP